MERPLAPRLDRLDRRPSQHDPLARRLDRHAKGALQVGLVEAGEHPVGVERLEVGVERDPAVGRIGEAVQPDAAAVVVVAVDHPHAVPTGLELGQLDAVVLPVGRARRAVDLEPLERGAGEVDPQRPVARQQLEAQRRLPRVVGVAPQAKQQAVVDAGDPATARGGLVAGQPPGVTHVPWRLCQASQRVRSAANASR